MKAESSAASWLKFFSAAGISKEDAENYAVTFSKNQIQLDMLPEIKKEYLKDMGITLMGHIIAILRHAKTVYADELKKTELASPLKQSLVSNSKGKSMTKESKVLPTQSSEEPKKQPSVVKRKSTVVQLKDSEPKNKVRKKLCDSSDDIYVASTSTSEVPSEESKKGVFQRLGSEISSPESSSSSTVNGSIESVFTRLGDKSIPQLSKETISSTVVKRVVAGKGVINKGVQAKSIIRTRLDNKPSQRIFVSPTYMDRARQEKDVLSRLSNNLSSGSTSFSSSIALDKRNIKARLGGTSSSQLVSMNRLSGTGKRVTFGSVYEKLIPLEKKPISKNVLSNIDFSSYKGSIGLSTGVFSRLGI